MVPLSKRNLRKKNSTKRKQRKKNNSRKSSLKKRTNIKPGGTKKLVKKVVDTPKREIKDELYPSGAPRYEVVKVPPGVQNGMKFLTGTSAGPMIVTCPSGVCQGSKLKIPIPDKNVKCQSNAENIISKNGAIKVKVPKDIYPGMSFLVETPEGLLDVLCPPGSGPGSMLEIQIPDAVSNSTKASDTNKASNSNKASDTSKVSDSDTLSDIFLDILSDDSLFKMKKGKKKKFLLEVTPL